MKVKIEVKGIKELTKELNAVMKEMREELQ